MVRNGSLIHIQAEQHEPNMHTYNSFYVYICMQMAACIHNSCHKLQGTTKRPPTPHKRLTAFPLWMCVGDQIYTQHNNSTETESFIIVCMFTGGLYLMYKQESTLFALFDMNRSHILAIWYNKVLDLYRTAHANMTFA